MTKVALITGVTGQDGAYLSKFLLEKGYKVYGTYRRLSTPNFWRLQYLDILEQVELVSFDLLDQSSMLQVIQKIKPDEVYNLAAQSFVGASFEQPVATGEITGLGVTRLLDTIRSINPKIKFYQASTSEMYGIAQETPQTEKTPFHIQSPYAAAKLYAHWITENYRRAYDMYAVSGILFNHESETRGLEFVTRKITNAVARIKLGLQDELVLGNIDSKRDWGYAPDFVEAMWLMMQQEKPSTYVVATGETHTVREFCELAFAEVGLDYKDYVKTSESLIRPSEVNILLGDATKAKEELGWEPKVKFRELISKMIKEDLTRWENYLEGKQFPWDAPNYTDWNLKLAPKYTHKE
jgi:GDPmannose 4,6-dehydratase